MHDNKGHLHFSGLRQVDFFFFFNKLISYSGHMSLGVGRKCCSSQSLGNWLLEAGGESCEWHTGPKSFCHVVTSVTSLHIKSKWYVDMPSSKTHREVQSCHLPRKCKGGMVSWTALIFAILTDMNSISSGSYGFRLRTYLLWTLVSSFIKFNFFDCFLLFLLVWGDNE